MAADDLQPVAKHLGRLDLHGGVLQVGGHIVGGDAGSVDFFKEINGHPKVYVAHAIDGQAHRVFAGIEHAVLAGAVVLELQQVVAVVQSKHVLGLTSVNKLLFHDDIPPCMKLKWMLSVFGIKNGTGEKENGDIDKKGAQRNKEEGESASTAQRGLCLKDGPVDLIRGGEQHSPEGGGEDPQEQYPAIPSPPKGEIESGHGHGTDSRKEGGEENIHARGDGPQGDAAVKDLLQMGDQGGQGAESSANQADRNRLLHDAPPQ